MFSRNVFSIFCYPSDAAGVTKIHPEDLRFPNTMTDLDHDTWMLRFDLSFVHIHDIYISNEHTVILIFSIELVLIDHLSTKHGFRGSI